MESYLKRKYKIGKTRMKKMRKGKLNHLWYEEFHKQYDFGAIYHINKLYTIFFVFAVGIHLLFGWMKIFSILFCVLFCIANGFLVILAGFAYAEYLIEEFGTVLVLFGVNQRKGIDSMLFFPVSTMMIIFSAVTAVKFMMDIYILS